MLKSVYVLNSDFKNPIFKENLLSKLNSKYKNIEIFYPIEFDSVKNSNIGLSKNDTMLHLNNGDKNRLFKLIIDKFNHINSEFIIVVGGFADMLDNALSKHLNSPFLLSDESRYKASMFDFTVLSNLEDIFKTTSACITPLNFEMMLYKKASQDIKTVVLPESSDERILKAAKILLESKAVKLILLTENKDKSKSIKATDIPAKNLQIIELDDNEFIDDFAHTLYELRKSKGLSKSQAKELIKDKTYFGTMLVYKGIADAMVSGASTSTANTIRPALQFIKMKPGVKTVSGSFIMCLDTKIQIFADCAITPNPTSDELAGIARSSAQTAKDFGLDPKVAMLSFSTGDSGCGADVDFVIEATQKVKELDPSLAVEGPVQFDAAVDAKVAAKKLPNSKVAGKANTFIFPNLNCGNICYKAVQRSANAVAIGPILQGLNKPINDLSRGCLVEDIVNTVLISAIQSQGE